MKSIFRIIASLFVIVMMLSTGAVFAADAPILVQKYTLGVDASSIWHLRAMQGKTYRKNHEWTAFKQSVCTLSGLTDCSDKAWSKRPKGTIVYLPASLALLMVPNGVAPPEELSIVPALNAPEHAQLFNISDSGNSGTASMPMLTKRELRNALEVTTQALVSASTEVTKTQRLVGLLLTILIVTSGILLAWIFVLQSERNMAKEEARYAWQQIHRQHVGLRIGS